MRFEYDLKKKADELKDRVLGRIKTAGPSSIQMTVLISFTLVSLICILAMGIALYQSFSDRSEKMLTDNAELVLDRTVIILEDHLGSINDLSDTIYNDIAGDPDMSSEEPAVHMDLLYGASRDNLISIALFDKDGNLLLSSPEVTLRSGTDITSQSWFAAAVSNPGKPRFSLPHVQSIYSNDNPGRYRWVISLSRSVFLNIDGQPVQGVLLTDMNYEVFERMMERTNLNPSEQYLYLCDSNGVIIYHPMLMQINAGLVSENSIIAASYADGSHIEEYQGSRRIVTVKTMDYTGWKLISVIPQTNSSLDMKDIRHFVIMTLSGTLLAMLFLNRFVARRVTRPIVKLNDSIRDIEMGKKNPSVYIGGPLEVEHLGRTLKASFERNRQLMNDMVASQEEKRKSELDALQSQINPHFLYNALDSIVWMIEGEKYNDAVFMITQLASLFRISLSRGRTIISISDEYKHACNYMNIQKVRFMDAFAVEFDMDEDILGYCTVKLVMQPILENAVYYGVKDMEDGLIRVEGRFGEDGDIYITVSDNGFGMTEEQLRDLLTDDKKQRTKGSGVGLINVHRRIQLRFGEEYGLKIESEPDEGTTVTIHLPAVEYNEVNVKRLESGKEKMYG